MLQSMGFQIVGYNLATEQHQRLSFPIAPAMLKCSVAVWRVAVVLDKARLSHLSPWSRKQWGGKCRTSRGWNGAGLCHAQPAASPAGAGILPSAFCPRLFRQN